MGSSKLTPQCGHLFMVSIPTTAASPAPPNDFKQRGQGMLTSFVANHAMVNQSAAAATQ